MANSKVLSVNNSNNRFTLRLTLTEGDYSIANNSSPVTYKLELIANTSYNFSQYAIGSSITLGGINVHYQARTTNKQYSIADYGTLLLASGTHTFTHDANGALDLSVSYSIDMASASYTPGALSGTGSFALTTIPRYANFTEHKVVSKDETSITMQWNADSSCDMVQYSIDFGTTWKTAQWPQYTISGLDSGTNYKVVTKIRRSDSGLWTESDALQVATYDYPYCTSSPNFTIGNEHTLTFYNPLSRAIKIYLALADGREIGGDEITGSSLSGYAGWGHTSQFYASIPNSQSGKYKVIVKYGDITRTRDYGNTYTIRGTEIPTINALSYVEGDDSIFRITNNNQHIVQGKSKLKVVFDDATPNFHAADIYLYSFTFNGETKRVSSPSEAVVFDNTNTPTNQKLTMTATDSRGVSNSKEIEVTMIPYAPPKLYPHTDIGYIQCQRCDENGNIDGDGTNLFLSIQGRWHALPEGQNTSYLEIKCSSTDGTDGTYEVHYQNTPSIDANNGYISKGDFKGKVDGVILKGTKSYVITIRCVDLLTHDASDNNGIPYKIPTAEVNMHLRKGGHGVAIGKYCETLDLFEVDYNSQFNKAINNTYIKSTYIGELPIVIKSYFAFENHDGGTRQSIFMFGAIDGYQNFYGLLTIWGDGTTKFVGSKNDITCEMNTQTGKVVVDIPTNNGIWSNVTFISGYIFDIE